MTRLFFCADIHGAETVWKKFLNAAKYLKADVLIMGGDLTAKRIVPIIEQSNGTWTSVKYGWDSKEVIMKSEKELKEFEEEIRSVGCYTCQITPEENERLSSPESVYIEGEFSKIVEGGPLDKLFDQVISESLHRWLDMIDDIMPDGNRRIPEETKVILCTGNDDRFIVDDIIKKDTRVALGDEIVLELDGDYEMISYGWTISTPWKSYRETTEEIINEKINQLASKISNIDSSIFCLHCPPYKTLLDRTQIMRQISRFEVMDTLGISVGSKSVKQAITNYQPLLSLHGHIHHGSGVIKIGRTRCMNPGSEYYENILKGFLIELNNREITNIQKIQA